MGGKLLVIVLLALTGAIYPPGFAEALRCYTCTSEGNCSGLNVQECSSRATGCLIERNFGDFRKGCITKDPSFDCVQEKLGQSGDCIRGTWSDMVKYAKQCALVVIAQDEPVDVDKEVLELAFKTNFILRQASNRQSQEEYVACICANNLCNTDDLLAGDKATSPASTTPNDGGNLSDGTTPSEAGSGSMGHTIGTDVVLISGLVIMFNTLICC